MMVSNGDVTGLVERLVVLGLLERRQSQTGRNSLPSRPQDGERFG